MQNNGWIEEVDDGQQFMGQIFPEMGKKKKDKKRDKKKQKKIILINTKRKQGKEEEISKRKILPWP